MGVFSRSTEMKSPLVLLISLSIGLGQDTKFVKTPSNGQSQNTKFFGFTDPNLGNSLVPGALGFGAGLLASNLIGGISGGSSGGGGCCCGRKKRQAESPDQKFFGGSQQCSYCSSCGGGGYRPPSGGSSGYNRPPNQINIGGGGSSSYNSCRCTSLTSGAGGNCSRDNTGKKWCYTTGWSSSCRDLHSSKQFPSNPWSYQACGGSSYGK